MLRNFAAGVPLTWTRSGHAAYPAPFRAAARVAALALHRRGLPSPLIELIVARAADGAAWPGLLWDAPGVARFIHTRAPRTLDELAAA